MFDYIKQRQREYYKGLIRKLRIEQIEMEACGHWEASAEIDRQISKLRKEVEDEKSRSDS
jgi:hypothetical protein